jgi:zinc transport system substrate-binding protein
VVDGLDNKNLILVEATHDMKLLGEEEHADKHVDEHEHEHAHEEEKHADEHAHEHGEYDPHVWLSPLRAIEQVRVIEAALSKADPQHQADYRNNADAYVVELEELHKQFQDALAPHAGKEFVTQHAAFAYIADAYNLIQLPIAGLSPENEPSAQRMAEIVAFAKEHQIRTIYFETLVSSKVAEVIAKEIGAKTAVLNPIEGLTADDLKNNANYVSLMKQNLQALLQGFEQ